MEQLDVKSDTRSDFRLNTEMLLEISFDIISYLNGLTTEIKTYLKKVQSEGSKSADIRTLNLTDTLLKLNGHSISHTTKIIYLLQQYRSWYGYNR